MKIGLFAPLSNPHHTPDYLRAVGVGAAPDAALTAWSPLNPEATRPLWKTWIDGLRKAGLDIPDESATAD